MRFRGIEGDRPGVVETFEADGDSIRALVVSAAALDLAVVPESLAGVAPWCERAHTDAPSVVIEIFRGPELERVVDYHGCPVEFDESNVVAPVSAPRSRAGRDACSAARGAVRCRTAGTAAVVRRGLPFRARPGCRSRVAEHRAVGPARCDRARHGPDGSAVPGRTGCRAVAGPHVHA